MSGEARTSLIPGADASTGKDSSPHRGVSTASFVAEEADRLYLGNENLRLVFDRRTGSLLDFETRDQSAGDVSRLAGEISVDVRVDGRWIDSRQCRLRSFRSQVSDGAAVVHLEWRFDNTAVEESWRLGDGMRFVERRARAWNPSKQTVVFRGFRLTVPGVRLGAAEKCIVLTPGEVLMPPGTSVAMAAAATADDRFYRADPRSPVVIDRDEGFELGRLDLPGTLFLPDISPGIVCVHNAEDALTLVATIYSETETTTLWIAPRGDERIDLVYTNRVETTLTPGAEVESATQYIWFLDGDWQGAQDQVACDYATLTPVPPSDRPPWLREGALFEVYAGEYGGFAGLREQLPRIRDYGFDVLYLLPLWECVKFDDPRYRELDLNARRMDRTWCPGKIPYFITDFDRLDSDLGTEADLKELVEEAHRLGMRVLLDLVMQGCADTNPLVLEHPDWFVRSIDGEIGASHGWDYFGPNLSLDWANPDVQEYFRDFVLRHVELFGVDGFRVDAASWKESNWAAKPPRIPSDTQFGGHHTIKLIRDALKRRHPEAVLLSEVPGSLFFGYHDALNDNRVLAMLQMVATGHLSARQLGETLATMDAFTAHDVLRVYSTDNHDASHWRSSPRAYRGSPVASALLALCILLGDIPLAYSGQERAHGPLLDELLGLRARHPALRGGRSWLRPQSVAEDVLTCIRRGDDDAAIVVISFAPESVPVVLAIDSADLGDADAEWLLSPLTPRAHLSVSNDPRSLQLSLELEPYTPYVWIARRRTH